MKQWYKLSYAAFVNQPIDSKEDIIRLIAFAYSWMPTIPEIKADKVNRPEVIKMLEELRGGDVKRLKELMTELVPAINNSIVGTSKVLHFVAPKDVPIIDANVVKAWNQWASKRTHGVNFRLPSTLHRSKKSTGKKLIELYLDYVEKMREIAGSKGTTIRQLEISLFNQGRRLRSKKKKEGK
jgi:hypothetical protein